VIAGCRVNLDILAKKMSLSVSNETIPPNLKSSFIVNRLWYACVRNLDSISRRGMKFVSSPKHRDHLRAHHALYTMDARGFLFGVKQPGPETDHLHPSSAKVKNDGSLPSLSPISSWLVQGQCLPLLYL
jgi:hypothetical protein